MELNLDWRARRSTVWPEVSYEIRPLRVWAFQTLLDYWDGERPANGSEPEAPGKSGEAGAGSLAAAARMMDVARRIFPEHVRNVSGLRLHTGDGNGAEADGAVTPDAAMLCDAAPLLPLAAEIVGALAEISTLDAGAEKN